MGLLDSLYGNSDPWAGLREVGPGNAGGGGFLASLLQPEVALPVAAGLLGGQGDQANFGSAVGSLGQGLVAKQQRNRTRDALRRTHPDIADAIDSGGLSVADGWKLAIGQDAAKKQGIINTGNGTLYDTDKGTWITAPEGAGSATTGLQPVLLQDENGKYYYGQPDKRGNIVRSNMPDGLHPVGPYDKAYETNRGTTAGKVTGQAQADIPAALQNAADVADKINTLKNDPYLSSMVGPINSRLPNLSSDAARVQSEMNQIQGDAFLQARQMLKGGGAITDFEGAKAEQAYARLNAAQSVEDYKAALDDFNNAVQQGVRKLQAAAGQVQTPGGAPATGGGGNDPLGIR